jgi:digeranylgeranylglycerophospholipid reductase
LTEYAFEAVVAGSGVAGAIAASLIARKGYRVALVESKKSSLVGLKVCGDGVGLHDFLEAGIDAPSTEAERTVQGVKFYLRSDEPTFTIHGAGVTLNRHAFGQRLLKDAQDHGAELFSENIVTKALLANDRVVGLVSRHVKGTNSFKASIVIDATGIVGAVRTTLPISWPVSETVNHIDIGLGYREYRQLTREFEDYCSIYYNWDLAPGGYCWIIPKKGNLVNTGLLIPWRHETASELESNFRGFVKENRALKDSKFIRFEIGLVPLRNPLPSAVADGFIAIGDAAYQANPLNGDGIGSAMVAARIAANTAVACLEMDDTSVNALWRFNVEYMKKQGWKYTANKLLSNFIRGLNSNHMIRFFEALGIRREYTSGDLFGELSSREKSSIILKMSSRPSLMLRLLALEKRMDAVSSHCKRFPEDPSHFPQWLTRLRQDLTVRTR